MVFKHAKPVETVRGTNLRQLMAAVKNIAAEADASGSSSGGFGGDAWLGASLPRGYQDVTHLVDLKGLDLLNSDSEFGDARTLFAEGKPSALGGAGKGKGKGKAGEAGPAAEAAKPDWVETDTDEQLMLYMPFQATLKVHTLLITSLPADAETAPMRPKTIQVYSNRAHVLGFEEAEGIAATHSVVLRAQDWDAATGTARVELRFVKFQNVTSLVVFVVDGEGSGERVRLDRLRIVGEAGEKRELGKLEKVGEGGGE
jgi:hypothetical protein